jgi:hypothetical protein
VFRWLSFNTPLTLLRAGEDEADIPNDPNTAAHKRLLARVSQIHPSLFWYSPPFLGRNLTEAEAQRAISPSSAATPSAIRSQQNKAILYNGRPDCRHGPHISIYHDSFGVFLDAMVNVEPLLTGSDYSAAQEFMEIAARVYTIENDRRDAMNQQIAKILGMSIIRPDYGTTKADGSVHTDVSVDGLPISVEILANEYKNEIGSGHSEPTVQIGFTMRKICILPDVCVSMGYIITFSCSTEASNT